MMHTAIALMTGAQMLMFWLKFAIVAVPICMVILYYMKHTKNKRILSFFNIEEDDFDD